MKKITYIFFSFLFFLFAGLAGADENGILLLTVFPKNLASSVSCDLGDDITITPNTPVSLAAGTHTLSFPEINGFAKPSDANVNISSGKITKLCATYRKSVTATTSFALDITASWPDKNNISLTIGARPDASDELKLGFLVDEDDEDMIIPVFPAPGASYAYLFLGNDEHVNETLCRDIRRSQEFISWKLYLSVVENYPGTLSWSGKSLPEGWSFNIVNDATGQSVDMSAKNQIEPIPQPGEYVFTITAKNSVLKTPVFTSVEIKQGWNLIPNSLSLMEGTITFLIENGPVFTFQDNTYCIPSINSPATPFWLFSTEDAAIVLEGMEENNPVNPEDNKWQLLCPVTDTPLPAGATAWFWNGKSYSLFEEPSLKAYNAYWLFK